MFRFLRATGYDGNPSVYSMYAIERAWEYRGLQPVVNRQGRLGTVVGKVASKLRLMRNLHRSEQGPILVAFMGYGESRLLPACFSNEFVPYCFDCWPPMFERWESFFRRHRTTMAMFSARQASQYFSERIPEMSTKWIPEALDPSEYLTGTGLSERDIDVLELGRKFDSYHDAITGVLRERGFVHLYEKVKGVVIFPEKQQFKEGLSRAKISICFPSSITHPARSGNVETLTLRYLESIAARCIVVGKCPRELVDLFGYSPVVEVEHGREAEQLIEILSASDQYQSFVDKNYARLLEVGTWDQRVDEMLRFIAGDPELPGAENLAGVMGTWE